MLIEEDAANVLAAAIEGEKQLAECNERILTNVVDRRYRDFRKKFMEGGCVN